MWITRTDRCLLAVTALSDSSLQTDPQLPSHCQLLLLASYWPVSVLTAPSLVNKTSLTRSQWTILLAIKIVAISRDIWPLLTQLWYWDAPALTSADSAARALRLQLWWHLAVFRWMILKRNNLVQIMCEHAPDPWVELTYGLCLLPGTGDMTHS